MKIIDGNIPWEQKTGYSKRIFVDGKDYGEPGGLVQEIKIKAGEMGKAHHHKIQTEIFYFLTDNGYRIINGERKQFKIGDLLVIEPNDIHATFNESSEDYLYLAFKFKYSPDDLYWE
jgi:quercetin dioxygenase-like cupin family protein